MRPTELRCEYAVVPLGIDARQPRLSWMTPAEPCGYLQSAYRIVVAGSKAALGAGGEAIWDSGKIASDRSVNVSYAGRPLGSGERCWWRVRTWDREDRAAAWSEAAWFEMGLLEPGDWQGTWIAAERGISAPLLRTEVTLGAAPARARLYLCGLGYYELRINGAKVGRQVLDPASTYYHNDLPLELGARVLYASHDVTGHLRAGSNAVGVMLGNGWYAAEADVPPSPSHRKPYGDRPRLLLQLEVELTEGEPVRVASGTGWKASAGPVRYNDYSHGESYGRSPGAGGVGHAGVRRHGLDRGTGGNGAERDAAGAAAGGLRGSGDPRREAHSHAGGRGCRCTTSDRIAAAGAGCG